MKILLYSYVFYPSIGGVETITATLAENIQRLGHHCIVVTEAMLYGHQELEVDYEIYRKPTLRKRLSLAHQCDLVHSNGASVAMFPFAQLANKPFIWTHNGYQVACVDGLGWFDGEPAPMTPRESLLFHLKKRGLIHFCKEAIKLSIRRYVADQVDLNIAATHWVAKRQPLKNQVVAYTPYPLAKLRAARQDISKKYDFIYVGRLVSEKGVDTLLQAFQRLMMEPEYRHTTLAVIGEGERKQELETIADRLKLQDKVFFLGAKRGQDLIRVIEQATIGIVPSIWEEPMGGVSLELMAAGKVVITSSRGGHSECVGDAGLKFENGNYNQLCNSMKILVSDHDCFIELCNNIRNQISMFDEFELTQRYAEIYKQCIESHT
ncbi:glycosyltransferase family 4 protein [Phormidium tenue]|uniref:Glycosyl transferase family 1 domain-containing protein n=1 Tax=Phormidium tenue NIES-30 TaxID=549789 RepID=A0A1U7JBA9_9CYAN|nr:glycosyltransferase family 4 protein [Phormidium tenue]MBD2230095.1 glycosyltransferase family 4 protein [Phormidium tenue FACHB-1052]OKH51068.1 hypothetical protein NIES30_03085 [Phormidium tenue NIES-30]